jgi:hypothetical protein
MSGNQEFLNILEGFDAGIGYEALSDEPSVDMLGVPEGLITYTIGPRADADPVAEVQKATGASGAGRVFLLIPGQAFDASGTRHGRGGGWYDRFLAAAPRGRLRIGICFSEQFSNQPLVRQSWDEPVDYVCIIDSATNTSNCIETHAREG